MAKDVTELTRGLLTQNAFSNEKESVDRQSNLVFFLKLNGLGIQWNDATILNPSLLFNWWLNSYSNNLLQVFQDKHIDHETALGNNAGND